MFPYLNTLIKMTFSKILNLVFNGIFFLSLLINGLIFYGYLHNQISIIF